MDKFLLTKTSCYVMIHISLYTRIPLNLMQNRPNYYNELKVSRNATSKEIKRAFRRLAKQFHPDKNRTKNADRAFQSIQTAYEVLGNDQKKWEYDVWVAEIERKQQRYQFYAERLRRSKLQRDKCVLVLQELLSFNHEKGIRLYEELQAETQDFCIDDFMDYAESRDCEFLIAEAYQTTSNHRAASHLYEKLLSYEKLRPVFHHFVSEIRDRLKKVYIDCLTNPENLENIPNDLQRIKDLKLSKRELAWVYRRLAELYTSVGLKVLAKDMLTKALQLNPKLAGIKKICLTLGLENPPHLSTVNKIYN